MTTTTMERDMPKRYPVSDFFRAHALASWLAAMMLTAGAGITLTLTVSEWWSLLTMVAVLLVVPVIDAWETSGDCRYWTGKSNCPRPYGHRGDHREDEIR